MSINLVVQGLQSDHFSRQFVDSAKREFNIVSSVWNPVLTNSRRRSRSGNVNWSSRWRRASARSAAVNHRTTDSTPQERYIQSLVRLDKLLRQNHITLGNYHHHKRIYKELYKKELLNLNNVYHVGGLNWNHCSATDVILQHPKACQAEMRPQDNFSVVWDLGASMCITNCKTDFVGETEQIKPVQVDGISSTLKLEAIGKVCWSLLDTNGKLRNIYLPAYYAPEARQRLLTTSVFCKHYPKNKISLTSNSWTIQPDPDVAHENAIDIIINPINNLPMTTCFRGKSLNQLALLFSKSIASTHSSNYNLSEPHKELLHWHYWLGHVGLRTIQFLMRSGALSTSQAMKRLHTRAANKPSHDLPKCAAYQFGRQTNRSVAGKVTRVIQDRSGILSADKLNSGQRVFVDHFLCSTRGRQVRGYGIRDPSGKSTIRDKTRSYSGGCIFIDAATGYIDIQFQSFLSANKTIEAVLRFEWKALDNGIVVSE